MAWLEKTSHTRLEINDASERCLCHVRACPAVGHRCRCCTWIERNLVGLGRVLESRPDGVGIIALAQSRHPGTHHIRQASLSFLSQLLSFDIAAEDSSKSSRAIDSFHS